MFPSTAAFGKIARLSFVPPNASACSSTITFSTGTSAVRRQLHLPSVLPHERMLLCNLRVPWFLQMFGFAVQVQSRLQHWLPMLAPAVGSGPLVHIQVKHEVRLHVRYVFQNQIHML